MPGSNFRRYALLFGQIFPVLTEMVNGLQHGRTQGGGGCQAAAPHKPPKTEIKKKNIL
jgi:hypothetical protein